MRRWPAATGRFNAVPRVCLGVVDAARRRRLAAALEQLGCEVVATHTGYHLLGTLADALLCDGARRPDAVVADAILPGCTGLSVLAGLRDLHWDVPVVLFTTRGARDVRRLAVTLGATAVLDRATASQRVVRTVGRVLGLRHERRLHDHPVLRPFLPGRPRRGTDAANGVGQRSLGQRRLS